MIMGDASGIEDASSGRPEVQLQGPSNKQSRSQPLDIENLNTVFIDYTVAPKGGRAKWSLGEFRGSMAMR